MPAYRGKAVLVDVDMERIDGKSYTAIDIPVPEAGSLDLDGVTRYGTGRAWVANEVVQQNKSQPEDGRTLGVAFLQSNRQYRVLVRDDEGNEMYVCHTGHDLRTFNEAHGEPATKRMERDRAIAEARKAPGAQMSLFDDWAVPGVSELRSDRADSFEDEY